MRHLIQFTIRHGGAVWWRRVVFWLAGVQACLAGTACAPCQCPALAAPPSPGSPASSEEVETGPVLAGGPPSQCPGVSEAPVPPSANADDSQDELLEDEVATVEPPPIGGQHYKHPLDGVSDAEVLAQLKSDPESLGSMSVGLPNGGSLVNPVQMPDDPRWVRVDKGHAWGTQETVDSLSRAIGKVYERYPDAPALSVGHISGPRGGFLRPHRSHQSGRDVDLGYYYRDGGHWYLPANATSLDRERTWVLVRALITETDVHFILIDHSIQSLLREYAEALGEDRDWLDDIFRGKGAAGAALIRHAPGHRTHMHVRFHNPIAQETARRSYPAMLQLKLIPRPQHFTEHRVKKGETLIHIAQRYGTTVNAIKRANGLRSNKILARRTYKVPRTGPASAGPRVTIPPRRLPPAPIPLPKPSR